MAKAGIAPEYSRLDHSRDRHFFSRFLRYQGSKSSAGFRALVLLLCLLVAALVFVTLERLFSQVWDVYGIHLGKYFTTTFDEPSVVQATRNTAFLIVGTCLLATAIATLLAWLNEATEATIGRVGTLLPVVPFLMPALALPLGWVFFAAPQAGLFNLIARDGLSVIGIHLTSGPLNIYSWPGLAFLYTIFLTGFAYLIMSSAIRNVDTNILDAARLAGASPVKVFRQILIPSIRTSLVSSFFLCLLPALAMYTIPTVIGPAANINVLSVIIIGMVNGLYPPQYAQAFMTGLMLLVPILVIWYLQKRSSRGVNRAFLSTARGSDSMMILGKGWRRLGRCILFFYMVIAVGLPLIGLLWVAGVSYWSSSLTSAWNPIANVVSTFENGLELHGIVDSVALGIVGGFLIMGVAQVLSYGAQLFPRIGGAIDGLVKSPATVTSILIGIGILLAFVGPPFHFYDTYQLLMLGFFVAFIPFASVVANAGLLQIGHDVIEASQVSGGSEMRTFFRIVRPLTRSNFAAGCVLVFILVMGDVNLSEMLSSSSKPTVGYVMNLLTTQTAYPTVAMYALLVSVINVVVASSLFALIGRQRR